jgi:hypothetical protein
MNKSYVLDVSQRPVHHGISESVRHIEGITTSRCQLMVSMQARDTGTYFGRVKDSSALFVLEKRSEVIAGCVSAAFGSRLAATRYGRAVP